MAKRKQPIKRQKETSHRLETTEADTRKLLITTVISLAGHLALFGFFIAAPRLTPQRIVQPKVIDVNLVSLPMAQAALTKPEPAVKSPPKPKTLEKPVPEPAPEPAPEPEPKPKPKLKKVSVPKKPPKPETPVKPPPKKAVSLAPKKAIPKTSLKKKTYKASKVKKSALKRIEEQVEQSRPDPIKKALERIRTAVREKEKSGESNTVGVSSKGVGKEKAIELLDIYRAEISFNIQKNWAYPEQMAGANPDLAVKIAIKVMRSGEIKDIWYDKRSGNSFLDESGYRAIQKSNPFPPFPQGVTQPFIIQGFRFTPTGLN